MVTKSEMFFDEKGDVWWHFIKTWDMLPYNGHCHSI